MKIGVGFDLRIVLSSLDEVLKVSINLCIIFCRSEHRTASYSRIFEAFLNMRMIYKFIQIIKLFGKRIVYSNFIS